MTGEYLVTGGMPTDQEGPVFKAPWEAKAFAIAVKLSEAGYFSWPEWVEVFASEIKVAEEHKDFDAASDQGEQYYARWLLALEKLMEAKQILTDEEVDERHQFLVDNPVPHEHVGKREPVCVA